MSDKIKVVEAPEKIGDFYPAVVATTRTVGPKDARVREFVGFMAFYFPSLESFGMVPDRWEEQSVSNGSTSSPEVQLYAYPKYNDQKIQALQDALYSNFVANSRNLNKSDSPEFPTTWDEYLTPRESGAYGRQLSEFKKALASWLVEATEYTTAQVAAILRRVDVRVLNDMDPVKRAKIAEVINSFMKSDSGQVFTGTTAATNLVTAANISDEDEDDLGFM